VQAQPVVQSSVLLAVVEAVSLELVLERELEPGEYKDTHRWSYPFASSSPATELQIVGQSTRYFR
jgi:hypothetical protein